MVEMNGLGTPPNPRTVSAPSPPGFDREHEGNLVPGLGEVPPAILALFHYGKGRPGKKREFVEEFDAQPSVDQRSYDAAQAVVPAIFDPRVIVVVVGIRAFDLEA